MYRKWRILPWLLRQRMRFILTQIWGRRSGGRRRSSKHRRCIMNYSVQRSARGREREYNIHSDRDEARQAGPTAAGGERGKQSEWRKKAKKAISTLSVTALAAESAGQRVGQLFGTGKPIPSDTSPTHSEAATRGKKLRFWRARVRSSLLDTASRMDRHCDTTKRGAEYAQTRRKGGKREKTDARTSDDAGSVVGSCHRLSFHVK